MRRDPCLDGRAEAVPCRQHEAALGPTEHPWDCTKIIDPLRLLARCWPASDVEIGNLADDGRLPEITRESRCFIDQRTISAIGLRRKFFHGLQELRPRSVVFRRSESRDE